MAKVEQSFMEPVGETNFGKAKLENRKPFYIFADKNRNSFTKEGLSFIDNRFFTWTSINIGKTNSF